MRSENRSKQERIEELEELCRGRGFPVTAQRRVIFEALLSAGDHPTADRVHRRIRRRLPSTSHTTVYRTLELLVALGVARKTCHPGGACRYDPNIERHHHLVCLSCDRLVDLEDPSLNRIPLPDRRRTGFNVFDYSIQFRGLCPECSRRNGAGRGKAGRTEPA
ncbi:MAG: transcriptional repressor [Candidatus Eisenbacteria bacterium]